MKRKKFFIIISSLLILSVSSHFVRAARQPNDNATDVVDFSSLIKETLFSTYFPRERLFSASMPDMCRGLILNGCEISSEYGWRRHPLRRRSHFHAGIDLAAKKGEPIFAPADGKVVTSGWRRGYGRMIALDHSYHWETKYGHLNRIFVKVGDEVKRGDIIGEVGSTGVSTGPHLHFEMLYFNSTLDPKTHFASLNFIREYPLATANR